MKAFCLVWTTLWIFGASWLCQGQNQESGSEKGFLLNRRPLYQQQSSSPCWSGHSDDDYDPVDEDKRGRHHVLLAAGAAAVGGAALGYHLGMKQPNQAVINNNIYNEYPQPCVVVQGGGGGGGGGILGGGGLLGHHPILSNLLLGGGNGGGGGSWASAGSTSPGGIRQNNINWNRAIRQFSRVIRPITRVF